MVRNLQVVVTRAVVRQLGVRGFSLHRVAEAAAIHIDDLRRLMEVGSALDRAGLERLATFALAGS
jgi:hypothetical protein